MTNPTFYPSSLKHLISSWAPLGFPHFHTPTGYKFEAGEFTIEIERDPKAPGQLISISTRKAGELLPALCWKSGEPLPDDKLKALTEAFKGCFLAEDGLFDLPIDLNEPERALLDRLAAQRGVSASELARDLLITKVNEELDMREKACLESLRLQLEMIYERFYDSKSFDPDRFANHILGCIEQVNFLIEKQNGKVPPV